MGGRVGESSGSSLEGVVRGEGGDGDPFWKEKDQKRLLLVRGKIAHFFQFSKVSKMLHAIVLVGFR